MRVPQQHGRPRWVTPPADAGFTLLELIIVLVLAGLFMVVAVPALRDTLIDDPLQASARRLIGYLDGVRELAVRERQGYLLRIDLDDNRINFYAEADLAETDLAAPTEKNLFTPKGDVRLRSVWQQNRELVRGGVAELWVNRQGYVAKTVLHLDNDGRDAISLEVLPFLVQIEVHEGIYEPEAEQP